MTNDLLPLGKFEDAPPNNGCNFISNRIEWKCEFIFYDFYPKNIKSIFNFNHDE